MSESSGPLPSGRVGGREHRRQDREVLGDVVGDRERRQRSTGDQELLADLDDLDQLRRVRVEVDHVPRFLRGGRAGVHRHSDIGLSECGRVVRAVSGHRDHASVRLLVADQLELSLGRRFGEEVVHARLAGDDGGGHGIVAGDHHGADPHPAQLVEALLHAAFDDVLQVDDAESEVVLGDDERRAARLRDALDDRVELVGDSAPVLGDELLDRVGGALAEAAAVEVDAAHPGRGREGHEGVLAELLLAQAEPLLGEHDDRAAFGRLVGERRELRDLGQLALLDALEGQQLVRLAVPERDRPRLVEQQDIDVTRGLDGPAGHGEHVPLHEAIQAGDADRREQRADRRRDQRDEQSDEDGLREVCAGVKRERAQGHDSGEEGDRETGEQDVERDLVRGLAPISALDERDHAVEERLAGLLRDLDHEPVGEQSRPAGDGRAVAAGLADDRCGLARDRRLVDRADALDDLAVGRDDLAGLDDDHVAAAELRGRHLLEAAVAVRRSAGVVVRVARKAFACALPRPSATASAKFAKSTVSQSQTAMVAVNQSGSASPLPKRSRKKITVVITAPSSTMKMTGFRISVRGSSFRNESPIAPRTISFVKMPPARVVIASPRRGRGSARARSRPARRRCRGSGRRSSRRPVRRLAPR